MESQADNVSQSLRGALAAVLAASAAKEEQKAAGARGGGGLDDLGSWWGPGPAVVPPHFAAVSHHMPVCDIRWSIHVLLLRALGVIAGVPDANTLNEIVAGLDTCCECCFVFLTPWDENDEVSEDDDDGEVDEVNDEYEDNEDTTALVSEVESRETGTGKSGD